MDRVSIRSFRAADLVERGLKDLARSRIDTTREVVFQPLGARFFGAREDAARIATLFREDGFHAPEGHFTRMALRVEPQLVERLATLDPRALEARLADAARNAVVREWPRAQGVYLVRFEPSARGNVEPVAHVYLSSRRTDGGPAPALTREDVRRFEAAWDRDVGRAVGLGRSPEGERGRAVLGPDVERLRTEWARSAARLFAVYSERLAGKATGKELADAVAQARVARAAWSREVGPPVDLRDVERRHVLDTIRLRIEGGSRYLRGSLEPHRRSLVETAASRAAGLPEGPDRRLAVVAWPAGRDLDAVVYFNQRGGQESLSNRIEPERLRAALESRLSDEIRRLAPSLDPTAEARAEELGRVYVRLPERAPVPEREVTAAAGRQEPGKDVGAAAIVVTIDRKGAREGLSGTAGGRGEDVAALDRLQAQERDWTKERVFSIRLRIPTGAEQLERADLGAEEKGLASARRIWRQLVERAEKEEWSYRDFLAILVAEEIAQRQQTRLGGLSRRAGFPFLKTIDDFDFTYQSTLRLALLGSALAHDFVTEGRCLILSGKPGRGKTHLAVAIAYRAIQNGFDALFVTAAQLIDALSAAFRVGCLAEALATYTHPGVLVVDEVGYLTYGTDAANMLFHVVNDRHRCKRSMIFTTNKALNALGPRPARRGPRPGHRRPRPRAGPAPHPRRAVHADTTPSP